MCLQLYIPKEGVCIAFSPSGVRAPQRATQGQPGRPAAAAEPYSEESFTFTRYHCLQREVSTAALCQFLLSFLPHAAALPLGSKAMMPLLQY